MNLCILLSLQKHWKSSTVFFSIALSIKMNILLYLPGFLLVINWHFNYLATLATVFFIVAFQLAIAVPFLQTNPSGYFKMAFDFSRVFDKKESAYWQFVPDDVFVSKNFHNALLVAHVAFLLVFLWRKAVYGRNFKEILRSLNLPSSFDEVFRPRSGKGMKEEGKD
jgi:alpha-1,3-mannosyltransferase